MATEQSNTTPLIVNITAAELRAGRRVIVCVLNDDIDSSVTHYIQTSIPGLNRISPVEGIFCIGFNWTNNGDLEE